MLREITWDQFLEWMAYDRIEPIGNQRGDWQAASICSIIANMEMIRQGRSKRFKTKDFLLEFTDEISQVEQPAEAPAPVADYRQMQMIARMHVALAKADEKRKGRRGKQ